MSVQVNISSVWLLPEEGFPVFYRYFRDRITWFEADAVCQFHHANLVTVDSSEQYDATRAYLKELDVMTNVWVGLKRSGSEGEFTWTDYKPLENGGYWQEQIPLTDNPVCAALDPVADYRWHPLNCGGPEVASFICQLEVPGWARKEDGCMLTSLPSLTVTYLPEQGAVELISDCGLEGTRRIACKGQANREEMMKQLSCESSTEGQTEATSSNTWDNEVPTRHRRDTEVTADMASVQHLVPTTEGLTEADSIEVTNDSPPADVVKESLSELHMTEDTDITSTQGLPQEMSAAEEPIKSSLDLITDDNSSNRPPVLQNLSLPGKDGKELLDETPIQVPLNSIARITSEEAGGSQEAKQQPGERRVIVVQSKPIPPSLRGNSPFIEVIVSPNKNETATEALELTTQKPVEKESHEVFRESKADISLPSEKHDSKAVNFPPLSVYKINNDGDPDESSSRVQTSAAQKDVEKTTESHTTPSLNKEKLKEASDSKFFTRVIAEDSTTTTASPVSGTKTTSKPNTDNDFFIVTESPVKITEVTSTKINPTVGPPSPKEADVALTDAGDDLSKSFSRDQEMADEGEPEVPERPNRGRLLVRPQHHSFYPYFLNRVLG